MKVLSLKQPYAELNEQGGKKIELRNWNTKFRGEFLIYDSKVPDKVAMEKFEFSKLRIGCIVGNAEIVDVKKYIYVNEFELDNDLDLASDDLECFGFILENVQRVKEIPCRGRLGFWEFE
jgi:hypothetical protein